MKVKELIALLQEQNPESRVLVGMEFCWRVYPNVAVKSVKLAWDLSFGLDAPMEDVVTVAAVAGQEENL